MLKPLMAVLLAAWAAVAVSEDLGQLSANPYGSKSTANPYNPAGSPYNAKSVKNPYGQYGSPYSAKSATNPFATDAPKLYDSQGNYRGKLSSNPYDPESISNPNGGAGNPYRADSPSNPYGNGWRIEGDDDHDVKAAPPRSLPSTPSYTAPRRNADPGYTQPSRSGYRAPVYGTRPEARDSWDLDGESTDAENDGDPWAE